MVDLYEFSKEVKWLSDLLETVRKLSKGNVSDYTKEPYDNDMILLQHLLDEKIKALYSNKSQ